ncbi:MAG: hypothetical protein JO112_05355 [Planctomycetes bacterium]|nr:hypothetical protein [Planctomycetota bacterium]
MADEKNRGGKKQENEKGPQGKEHQGTAAPIDKKQPGHATDPKGRKKFQEEANR